MIILKILYKNKDKNLVNPIILVIMIIFYNFHKINLRQIMKIINIITTLFLRVNQFKEKKKILLQQIIKVNLIENKIIVNIQNFNQ